MVMSCSWRLECATPCGVLVELQSNNISPSQIQWLGLLTCAPDTFIPTGLFPRCLTCLLTVPQVSVSCMTNGLNSLFDICVCSNYIISACTQIHTHARAHTLVGSLLYVAKLTRGKSFMVRELFMGKLHSGMLVDLYC